MLGIAAVSSADIFRSFTPGMLSSLRSQRSGVHAEGGAINPSGPPYRRSIVVLPAGSCFAAVPLLATRGVHVPHSAVHRAVMHTVP